MANIAIIGAGISGLAAAEDYAILAKSVANKVFFAGDATHSTYPNTTHGAYMSGIRAANEIQLLL